MPRISALVLLASVLPLAQASTPTTWEMNTFADFLKGDLKNVAITRDGHLTVAPGLHLLYDSQQPVIWSLAQGMDGITYAGTGHHGRVYQIDTKGRATLLWSAPEPEVFALAVSGSTVYAATSPNGKVYRIQSGKATEYFDPKAAYIWSLAVTPNGTLYAGTGEKGQIFQITGPGQGTLYYDTQQAHVTALALNTHGELLAGTEPNGILYSISAQNKASVLYDSNLPEIHSLALAPDGAVYAAALGGGVANRISSATTAATSTFSTSVTSPASTTITVTGDAAAQSGADPKAKTPEPVKPAVTATQAVTTVAPPVIDLSGVEKSAIYRINADGSVETIWSSKEENAFDIAFQGADLLFSTDKQGRIYRLDSDRKPTLLLQTDEGEALRLAPTEKRLLIATGSVGKLFEAEYKPPYSASYDSPVHDTGSVSRWGRLTWNLAAESSSQAYFSTRSGNVARPDRTWSDWKPITAGPGSAPIPSPNARYIQWRATFASSNNTSTPVLTSVSISYLTQNAPPVVKSISASLFYTPSLTAKATPTSAATAVYSVTVSENGDTSSASSAGSSNAALQRASSQQMLLSWQADDPDGDKLSYSIYARTEAEQNWKLLRKDITDSSLTIDSDALSDGRYFFRIVATDRPSNPASTAREAELTSAPMLIDNTPPQVHLNAPAHTASAYEIQGQAQDSASPIKRVEYSIDAGPWLPAEAEDGIFDSLTERFSFKLDALVPGEHLVVVRAFDGANNAGLAKLVLR